jgi:hypothetical protein
MAPAPAAQTGVVAIGGEAASRAEIVIDGVSRGHAPHNVTLPVGAHSVVLVRPEGTRLGPRAITVAAQHTPSAPLRVLFP